MGMVHHFHHHHQEGPPPRSPPGELEFRPNGDGETIITTAAYRHQTQEDLPPPPPRSPPGELESRPKRGW